MKRISNCPGCNCEIWLPDELHEAAIRSPKINFFCVYGHKQHFSEAGIAQYWAKKPKAIVIQLFKGKGHEAQQHP